MSWLEALRQECDRTSQARVARKLGLSAATISQVLSGNYAAATDHIERKVRAQVLKEKVDCPVLGVIGRSSCQEEQDREFAMASPLGLRVWRACRAGCPNSFLKED